MPTNKLALGGVLALVAAAILGLTAPAALGQAYGSGGVDVSDRTPPAGGTIVVVGTGFAPNSTVEVSLPSASARLGAFRADGVGRVEAQVTLPAGVAGTQVIQLAGTASDGSPRVLETSITIGGRAAEQALPYTGSSTASMVAVGASAVAVGFVLVAAAGRRRQLHSQ